MSFNLINYCEIDKFASTSYSLIHNINSTLNLGDISEINTNEVKDFDLLVGGSPCFVGETLVLTLQGYKEIKNIKVGDMVLSHDGKYHRVINVFNQGIKKTYAIKAMGFHEIKTTINHKFYVRKKEKVWNQKNKCFETSFSSPKWITIEELLKMKNNEENYKNYYLGCSVNNNSLLPEYHGIEIPVNQFSKKKVNTLNMNDENFWYLVGRFLGYGWIKQNRKGEYRNKYNGVIICCSKKEATKLESKIKKTGFHFVKIEDETVFKYQISNTELATFLSQFGIGALEKHLPGFIFDLPINLLKYFLTGYFDSDGWYSESGYITTCSVSKSLTYGIAQCIMKVYKKPCAIYITKVNKIKMIENRLINQHDTYQARFKLKKNIRSQAFFEEGCSWFPITEIKESTNEVVYDIEVSESHSFLANNCIAHNCQDMSIAGKKAGATYTCLDCGHKYNPLEQHYTKRDRCPSCNSKNIEVTRSSLIVHYLRFLHDKKPKFALYENVKNLQNKEFRPTFNLFLKEIEEYGYKVFWQVLNGKDYGIPQNRERIIVVLIRKDIYKNNFVFPEKIPLKISVKDILETDVPEKYYLSKEKSDSLIVKLISNNKLKENYNSTPENNMKMFELLPSLNIKDILENNVEGSFTPPICVASRGRNPENPNCRIAGLPTEQRLEINYNEITNTLTSVQKDNYILEETLPTIMKPERNEYGKTIRKDYESGKIKEKMGNIRDLTPRKDGISNTLTTVQKDNYLLEKPSLTKISDNFWVFQRYKKFYDKNHYIPKYFNPLSCEEVAYSKSFPESLIFLDKEKQQQMKEICENLEIAYRIRKLTPRECYRLMGFNDKEYDRARYFTDEERTTLDNKKKKYKVEYDTLGKERAIKTSDAQLYKQAGNSIIVDMLYYICKELKEQYPEDFKDIKICSLFSGIGAFESALYKLEHPDELVSKIFSKNFLQPPMN